MATIYADASGNILRFLMDADQEAWLPSPPPGTSGTIRFDERTNTDLVSAFLANPRSYSVSGSTLMLRGAPVTPAANSSAYNDRQAMAAIWAALKSDSSPSAAQLRVILRFILRKLYKDE